MVINSCINLKEFDGVSGLTLTMTSGSGHSNQNTLAIATTTLMEASF